MCPCGCLSFQRMQEGINFLAFCSFQKLPKILDSWPSSSIFQSSKVRLSAFHLASLTSRLPPISFSLFQISNLNSFCILNTPLPCNITYPQVKEIRIRHLCGPLFCLPRQPSMSSHTALIYHLNCSAYCDSLHKTEFQK